MEVLEVKVNDAEKSEVLSYEEFIAEMTNDYLTMEINEKEELKEKFSKVYKTDKDSFNGLYLRTLIDVLEEEIKEIKNKNKKFFP